MVDFVIRKAEKNDYTDLLKLYRQVDEQHYQALPEIFEPPKNGCRSVSWLEDRLQDTSYLLLVAEDQQQILGLIEVQIRQTDHPLLKPKKYGHLCDIVVDLSWRRNGIGKALMNKAHQWAKSQGAEDMELVVFSFNTEALSFYRSLNYVNKHIKLKTSLQPISVE